MAMGSAELSNWRIRLVPLLLLAGIYEVSSYIYNNVITLELKGF